MKTRTIPGAEQFRRVRESFPCRGTVSAKALRQEWVWWLWDTERRSGQVACKERVRRLEAGGRREKAGG